MEIIKYLAFALILFYIPMWSQINLFLSSIGKAKKSARLVKDEWIIKILKEKSGMNMKSIRILNSSLFFGMMAGIPGNPQLMLSKELYEDFNKNELEYVLFHEAGHYKLGHSVIELSAGILLLVLGIFILNSFQSNVLSALLLGLLFGILMIQFGRLKEVQADNFSLKRMTNPEGMITATNKLVKAWESRSTKNKIILFLFYRGNPYKNRIKMANSEISDRKASN